MEAASLLVTAQNVKNIIKFVSGSGLSDAIAMIIGDTHLEAAKLALEVSQVSTSPQERVNSAINHLETAHIAYKNIHKNPSDFYKKMFDYIQSSQACRKDVWVCCLIALCYVYLQDYQASKKFLDLAENALRDEETFKSLEGIEYIYATPLAIIGWLNIRNWQEDKVFINKDKFIQFKQYLSSVIDSQTTSQ